MGRRLYRGALSEGSGAITTSGTGNVFDPAGTFVKGLDWSGDAQLDSSFNIFNGNMTVSTLPQADLRGMFFGPHAEEVGAAFGGSDGAQSVIGTLVGRD